MEVPYDKVFHLGHNKTTIFHPVAFIFALIYLLHAFDSDTFVFT